jgi:transposase
VRRSWPILSATEKFVRTTKSSNMQNGFEQLQAWLKNRHADDVHVCMETTGAYWETLAIYFHGLEHRVSVVNPARIKAFAQRELLRTKTDVPLLASITIAVGEPIIPTGKVASG